MLPALQKERAEMILKLDGERRDEVNRLIRESWSGPVIVTQGIAHDTSSAEGFVAVEDGAIAGYILYGIREARCEILVLESMKQNGGIGTALIDTVKRAAKEQGCSRLWLITTNDNIHAIRYYQRRGFELAAVYINAIEKSRALKPSIPLIGDNDIPIKHEFEFALAI